MRAIQKGATDQSVVIRIIDSTTFLPETGVTSATGGLDLYYRREGGAEVALTESDLAAINSAHSDGGMKHIRAGLYRVDLPDAAVATGADGVMVYGEVTGMIVIPAYHPLVAYNPQDAVRLGLTALPAAAADAAGGLIVSDAGGLDADAAAAAVTSGTHGNAALKTLGDSILEDTAEIGAAGAGLTEAGGTGDHLTAINLPNQTMDIVGNITGNLSGSVGSVTGAVGSVTGAVGSVTGNVGGNVVGSIGSLGAQAKLDVNAEADTALTDYDGPTNAEMEARTLAAASYATASALTTVGTNVSTLLTRIPAALFSGITSLAQWLGLIAGKQTGDSTARTELRATGAGSGTFDETADSQEAIRDRGDAAWTTATGFSTHSAADVATAVQSSAAANPLPANVKEVADVEIEGEGTVAAPWGPAA